MATRRTQPRAAPPRRIGNERRGTARTLSGGGEPARVVMRLKVCHLHCETGTSTGALWQKGSAAQTRADVFRVGRRR